MAAKKAREAKFVETPPTLPEWQRLYQAAMRLKELAPWEWMEEDDVFGVQDPETGDLNFVSVMGSLGEHVAVAVYLGPQALYSFWDLHEGGPSEAPERILEIPQLQASFEDRSLLGEEDIGVIRQLGLKFRGRQAWPLFRSYRPGFCPWFLEANEARLLATALEQTVDVAARFLEAPSLLEDWEGDQYLVRVPRQESGGLAWEDRVVDVPAPAPLPIEIRIAAETMQGFQSLGRGGAAVEVDLFMMPTPVREQGRPFFPYMLLVVEPQSGLVLGSELLSPEPSLEAMWGSVPAALLEKLVQVGFAPREVRVRSGLLQQLLQPPAGALGLKVKQMDALPALDAARESLMGFLCR